MPPHLARPGPAGGPLSWGPATQVNFPYIPRLDPSGTLIPHMYSEYNDYQPTRKLFNFLKPLLCASRTLPRLTGWYPTFHPSILTLWHKDGRQQAGQCELQSRQRSPRWRPNPEAARSSRRDICPFVTTTRSPRHDGRNHLIAAGVLSFATGPRNWPRILQPGFSQSSVERDFLQVRRRAQDKVGGTRHYPSARC